MRFERLYRTALLMLVTLLLGSGVALSAPAAKVDEPTPIADFFANITVVPAAEEKPVKKKATEKKPAKAKSAGILKPRRRPARLAKVEVKSPDSLDGQVFRRIGSKTRLSRDDAGNYARIFALQEAGNFKKANEIIRELDDHRLMGHVLQQRFLSPSYKAIYKELADWMKAYADHPRAQKIYDLAAKKKRDGSPALTPPNPGRGLTGYHDYDSGQLATPYLAEQNYNPQEKDVIKSINQNLSESPTVARRRLETARGVIKDTKYDALQAKIAESYFYNNRVNEAYTMAAGSSDRAGDDVPLAGWIAGLSAWKHGKYEEAATHFGRTALSPRASAWMQSAGAFWAARAHLRSHHPEHVSYWLQKAAEHPRSFYGIIAVKALGLEQTRFNWAMPELTDKMAKMIAATPAGKRALALMDSERSLWAEQEIRQIDPGADVRMQEALLAFAHAAGAPSFEMRLGSALRDPEGKLYDAALYPDAPWKPAGGYTVDKALVYAFIRQESKFDAGVENKSSGAQGLMQLIPSTGMLMARKLGLTVTDAQLGEPEINIRLGQKYLEDLLREDSVKNNLFKLAVAYNAGPGKLSRWERTVDYQKDPLLFIESIPVAETRLFIERVLTNYWIYRLKYGQNTDSLEMVASGEWPVYQAMDIRRGPVYAEAARSLLR